MEARRENQTPRGKNRGKSDFSFAEERTALFGCGVRVMVAALKIHLAEPLQPATEPKSRKKDNVGEKGAGKDQVATG